MEIYSVSDLHPAAQFAIGMTYGSADWMQQGMLSFQTFIRKTPDLALMADAGVVVQELK